MLWVALSLTPGIAIRRIHSLIRLFGSVEAAWTGSRAELVDANVPADVIHNLIRQRETFDAAAYAQQVEAAGATVIVYPDADYPASLRTLPDAPPVLYVRGQMLPVDARALTIVGTRRATPYGREATRHLTSGLVAAGLTIISGLAHGIDAQAHQSALDSRGRTIAVLGCGIDRVYPHDHAALARRIADNGAVISEFPIGTAPEPTNFPRRNRILSGLSLGVVIVEAPRDSGALITARLALDQGREVFAVPGSIFNPNSAGTHELIGDGAKIVIDLESILEELPDIEAHRPMRAPDGQDMALAPISDEQTALLRAFGGESIQMDTLVRAANMPAGVVAGMLGTLEIAGFIELEQGGIYRMTRMAIHILNTLDT